MYCPKLTMQIINITVITNTVRDGNMFVVRVNMSLISMSKMHSVRVNRFTVRWDFFTTNINTFGKIRKLKHNN